MKLKIKNWKNWSDVSQWACLIIVLTIFLSLLFVFMFKIVGGGDPYGEYCAGTRWFDGVDPPCPPIYATYEYSRDLLYLFILVFIGGVALVVLNSYLIHRRKEKNFKEIAESRKYYGNKVKNKK